MNPNNENAVPPWARKADEYGRRRWHKEKSFNRYRNEGIWAIIINLVFLYIVNKIPDWDLKFITESYGAVIWILNLNILVQIGGSLLTVLFNVSWIRYLSRIGMEAASFVTSLVLYFIYPFDFSNFHGLSWIDWLLPIVLIIGMIISALKIIANIWKLIFWRY